MEARELDEALAGAAERTRRSVVALARYDARGRHGAFGSGFVAGAETVLTNAHVVGDARRVELRYADGSTASGQVQAVDRATDLAVVRAPGPTPPPLELGASEHLRVGQIVLAVGHSLGLPGGPTVSLGVVSALGRPLPGSEWIFEGVLQTDAAINPGNSGGPLVDSLGRVVGVNTAIAGASQGVGFAVPSQTIQRVRHELALHGHVPRPRLGLSGWDLDKESARQQNLATDRGVLVGSVEPGSPAARAGIRAGDVLRSLGGRSVDTVRELRQRLSELGEGRSVELGWDRTGVERRATVRPVDPTA
jgi:serine protease Do